MTWLDILLTQPLLEENRPLPWGILLLGSQAEEGLLAYNQLFHTHYPQSHDLVAFDSFGGLFALVEGSQIVHYLAPDSLAWEDLELTYPTFLDWAASDRPAILYESFWFSGAEPMAEQVSQSLVISTYPPL